MQWMLTESGAVQEGYLEKKGEKRDSRQSGGPVAFGKILKDLQAAEGPGDLPPAAALANLSWEIRSDSRAAASVVNGRWELAKDRADLHEICDETVDRMVQLVEFGHWPGDGAEDWVE